MAEKKPSASDVWHEHVDGVHVPAHAAYMTGVVLGGFLLMLALIAVLGGTAG
jgi:hypothetical protein